MWSFFVTMLFAPLFVWLDFLQALWAVGLAFGVVHEGMQLLGFPHKETWRNAFMDIGDFVIGGLVAWGLVAAIVYLA